MSWGHLHRGVSNRPTLAVGMRPVNHILVHFGPEESRVGVSLHEAVDFSLDLVEARRRRILQALLGFLSGAMINVHLQRRREVKHYFSTERKPLHSLSCSVYSYPEPFHCTYHAEKVVGIGLIKGHQQLLSSLDDTCCLRSHLEGCQIVFPALNSSPSEERWTVTVSHQRSNHTSPAQNIECKARSQWVPIFYSFTVCSRTQS